MDPFYMNNVTYNASQYAPVVDYSSDMQTMLLMIIAFCLVVQTFSQLGSYIMKNREV